jgi:hypothetical protein
MRAQTKTPTTSHFPSCDAPLANQKEMRCALQASA